MDAVQDTADVSVLVFSPEYVCSDYCLHEMQRALAHPQARDGAVVAATGVKRRG